MPYRHRFHPSISWVRGITFNGPGGTGVFVHAAGSRHRRFRQPAEVARGHERGSSCNDERAVIAAVHAPIPAGSRRCVKCSSSLPMTIRDPAPNVGVPSVAPRRQRGLRSAETELCLAAAFRRGVGNCTRSRVLTMLKPCNAARLHRSSSARDHPSSTSMECIGRSPARAPGSNARASSFRPRRWPTGSGMERPRSCHARHPKSRRPARMATFLGIGPRDHYLHRG